MSDRPVRYLGGRRGVMAAASLLGVVLATPALAAATPAPTAVSSAPTGCPGPDDGEVLDDRRNGFRLVLPHNWRNLRPGDEGWTSVYGERGTSTELDVASGLIADFAVPLMPPDADPTVNLTVYVEGIRYDDSLDMLAASYGFMLTQVDPPARTIRHDPLSLPAGPAFRLTAEMPGAAAGSDLGSSLDYRLVVFVLVHGGRAWFLAFSSSATMADGYARTFDCVGWSLRFDGAPDQSGPEGIALGR